MCSSVTRVRAVTVLPLHAGLTGRCKEGRRLVNDGLQSATGAGLRITRPTLTPQSFPSYLAPESSAGMRFAPPAAAAQGGGDHGRAFAGTFGDVDGADRKVCASSTARFRLSRRLS